MWLFISSIRAPILSYIGSPVRSLARAAVRASSSQAATTFMWSKSATAIESVPMPAPTDITLYAVTGSCTSAPPSEKIRVGVLVLVAFLIQAGFFDLRCGSSDCLFTAIIFCALRLCANWSASNFLDAANFGAARPVPRVELELLNFFVRFSSPVALSFIASSRSQSGLQSPYMSSLHTGQALKNSPCCARQHGQLLLQSKSVLWSDLFQPSRCQWSRCL